MACPIDNGMSDAALVLVGFIQQHSNVPSKTMAESTETATATEDIKKVSTTAPPSLAQMRVLQQTGYAKRQHPSSLTPQRQQQQQTKRRRIEKRSVRFECPPVISPVNNDHPLPVRTQVYVYDKVEHVEKQHVWWTPDELRHIHKRERSMVGILSHCCGFYVDQLSRLTEISFDASKCDEDLSKEPSYVWVANSPGRGLESQVTASLINSTESTKTVIRSVLGAQKQLKEHWKVETGLLSPLSSSNAIQDVLKAHYERLSAPRKRYAQFLAAGDALVARFKEEEDHEVIIKAVADQQQEHGSIGISA